MRIRTIVLVGALSGLAACGSSDDAASDTPAPTATAAPTAATAPSTTAAATTTATPTTVAAPTTTTPELAVEFDTSGQQVTPLTFADPQIAGMVIHSNAAGDAEGSLTSALVSIGGTDVALVWFEGRVADCGEGGMAIRIGTRPDLTLGWEVVPGLGTGDLATVTGAGLEIPPHFSGSIRCNGGADPAVFASTILSPMPPPDAGPSMTVPAHAAIEETDTPVTPHPDQRATPPIVVAEVVYDQWTSPQIYLGTRSPGLASTPVNDTMVSALVYPDICGAPAVVRVFMENPLFFDWRGAWDVAPGVNGTRSGAGAFGVSENAGVLVCP